jgi:hypothetical protein
MHSILVTEPYDMVSMEPLLWGAAIVPGPGMTERLAVNFKRNQLNLL